MDSDFRFSHFFLFARSLLTNFNSFILKMEYISGEFGSVHARWMGSKLQTCRDLVSRFPSPIASEPQVACFATMWLCINEPQQVTLKALLGLLARQNIRAEKRNDTLSLIDNVLHTNNLTDAQNDTVDIFMTLLRDLEAPGVRDMHVLACRACLTIDDSVTTHSDHSMHTVVVHSADSRSHDSGRTGKDSAGESSNSGSFAPIVFENLEDMQVVAEGEGSAVGSFGTFSLSNTNPDCAGPPGRYFDTSS